MLNIISLFGIIALVVFMSNVEECVKATQLEMKADALTKDLNQNLQNDFGL